MKEYLVNKGIPSEKIIEDSNVMVTIHP
ncbi:hypothetical protein P9265_00090 [Schinkia azotoformans]|nr:hypothetical protein [Schinkia azotoformans]